MKEKQITSAKKKRDSLRPYDGKKRPSKVSVSSSYDDADDVEGQEILETIKKLQDLHEDLRDCHRSLLYLEKCFKV